MTCEIRVARGLDDLLVVYAVRAAVYIAEQECPFAEEFDGNDHCATHLLGLVDGEPAGCLRLRFFHEFVKFERLAVLRRFRKSRLASALAAAAFELAGRKGFRRMYALARDGLEDFYAQIGASPMAPNRRLSFSGFNYTEMLLEIEPAQDAITLHSDPHVINRPEGDWDRPGILEISARRPTCDASQPVGEAQHAL